jgi:hypothetical protein
MALRGKNIFIVDFIYVKVCILCVCRAAVQAAEMQLKPLGEVQHKPLGGAMVFTCEVTTGDDDPDDVEYQLQWFDTTGQEVTDKSGRCVKSMKVSINAFVTKKNCSQGKEAVEYV